MGRWVDLPEMVRGLFFLDLKLSSDFPRAANGIVFYGYRSDASHHVMGANYGEKAIALSPPKLELEHPAFPI